MWVDHYIGAATRVSQRRRHRHLTAQPGIVRLELEHLDHLLVRQQLAEVSLVGIGVRGRLSRSCARPTTAVVVRPSGVTHLVG